MSDPAVMKGQYVVYQKTERKEERFFNDITSEVVAGIEEPVGWKRPQSQQAKRFPHACVGIDFGVDRQLTLSNGLCVREGVVDSKRIARLHRELSRRQRGGANYRKTLKKLNAEYGWVANQRKDIRNKVSSRLASNYETISVQDDCIKGWERIWGRRLRASALGGLMSALRKRAHTLIVVPRFDATTRKCSWCETVRETRLRERIFRCLTWA